MKRSKKENAWCAGWVAGWNAQASMKRPIRCFECIHMAEDMTGGYLCERFTEGIKTTPDKFCAWGERKVVE